MDILVTAQFNRVVTSANQVESAGSYVGTRDAFDEGEDAAKANLGPGLGGAFFSCAPHSRQAINGADGGA